MLILVCVLLSNLLMHPIRESLSEMTLNQERKCYEVSLRLSAEDEQWLLGQQSPVFEGASDFDSSESRGSDNAALRKSAIERLRQHYQIEDSNYRWIGRQEDSGHVWWHFEIEPRGAVVDLHHPTLTITLLRDRNDRFHPHDDFLHRLTIIGQNERVGYDFTAEQARHRIEFAK